MLMVDPRPRINPLKNEWGMRGERGRADVHRLLRAGCLWGAGMA